MFEEHLIMSILYERVYVMALSDETLEQIVSNLTPEEREQLFSQLDRQIQQNKKDISGRKSLNHLQISPKGQKTYMETIAFIIVFIAEVPD